eukprot:s554_g13.t1
MAVPGCPDHAQDWTCKPQARDNLPPAGPQIRREDEQILYPFQFSHPQLGMAQILFAQQSDFFAGSFGRRLQLGAESATAESTGLHADPKLQKMALRGILSSKSESNLRQLPCLSPVDDEVTSSGYPRRPSLSARSRTNSGRLISPPQEIDHPWETCPFRTLFLVVQDMLVLKYGLELDELDFINKAKDLLCNVTAEILVLSPMLEAASMAGLELGNSSALALDVLSMEAADIDSHRSLAWLWQTVAATCCWAVSDVICEAWLQIFFAPAFQLCRSVQMLSESF